MASLDSQGEIVSIELPNPEETQIWESENESYVPANIWFYSFCLLLTPLFDKQGLDAMVTVWLTSKKNPES